MSNILNYSSFSNHIKESKINEGFTPLGDPNWPTNWKDMPEWKTLQQLGFSDVTTSRMAANETILLKNFTMDLGYRDGIVLQKSGYIRDKSVSSGFIKRYTDHPANLKEVLEYLIEKWEKVIQRNVRTKDHGPLTDDQIKAINSVTKGKWKYNAQTKKVDVSSSVKIDDKDVNALSGVEFGNVDGSFLINAKIKDLSLAPRKVGGEFRVNNGDFLKNLIGCPDVVERNFAIVGARVPKDITGMPLPGNIKGTVYLDSRNNKEKFLLHFWDPSKYPWTMEGITNAIEDFKEGVSSYPAIGSEESLISLMTYLEGVGSGNYLYKYFEENPLDIYLLNSLPELKERVLKKLGIKDIGRIGKMIKTGLY